MGMGIKGSRDELDCSPVFSCPSQNGKGRMNRLKLANLREYSGGRSSNHCRVQSYRCLIYTISRLGRHLPVAFELTPDIQALQE
jgi:hypothetical protein